MCSLKVRQLTLEELWSAWDRYEQLNGVPSPFQTAKYAQCWLSHIGRTVRPKPLTAWSGEEPVGIFPLVKDPASDVPIFYVMGDIDTADYIDCLMRSDPESTWLAVLVHLAELYLNGYILRCQGVPPWSPSLPGLARLAAKFDIAVSTRTVDVSPIVELPPSWEEYLRSLDKHDRHELRRKLRRAEAGGKIEIVLHRTADDNALKTFFTLMKASSPDKQAYLNPDREEFFRCLVEQMASLSCLRMYELRLEDRPAAAILCFELASTLFLYNSGYDPAYAHLSLGYVLVAMSIKDAIERGVKRYDFLRGRERYKYDLGGKDNPITEVEVAVSQKACHMLTESARCRLC
jgi:CelD/BcsL family acetyltransferase involved in cellulose biosynthesis